MLGVAGLAYPTGSRGEEELWACLAAGRAEHTAPNVRSQIPDGVCGRRVGGRPPMPIGRLVSCSAGMLNWPSHLVPLLNGEQT